MILHKTFWTATLLSFLGPAFAVENFDMAELAKVRGEETGDDVTTTSPTPTFDLVWKVTATSADDVTTSPTSQRQETGDDVTTTSPTPTFDLVWKVTATSASTRSVTVGTKEHGLIMDAVHHTMMDYEFRQMWMSLMRHSYPLFLSELQSKGPATFIKPKFAKGDDTFKGEKGARRWQFLIQYFEKMTFKDFERILHLFDYERHHYEAITFSTFSSPPLPTGYWERTNPDFWKHYTEKDDEAPIDPWKYTLNADLLRNLHSVNPRVFTTPDK